jgi:hypothetical protein
MLIEQNSGKFSFNDKAHEAPKKQFSFTNMLRKGSQQSQQTGVYQIPLQKPDSIVKETSPKGN